jgi:hypothetical protein
MARKTYGDGLLPNGGLPFQIVSVGIQENLSPLIS